MSIDNDRSQLLELLANESLLTDGEFTLASGGKSKEYVDAKMTTCLAAAKPLVGRVFLRKMRELSLQPQAVGGLTVGADPIACSIARESLEMPPAINSFIVRKAPKEHGRQQFIEGIRSPMGCRVVIIDDVCTKGGSTGLAIEKAQEAGMHILGVLCLVDREEGASQYLMQKFGYTLHHIFTLAELRAYKHQSTPVTMAV